MKLSKTLDAFIASPNFFETDKVKLFVEEAIEQNIEVPYNAYVSKSTHCHLGLSKYEIVQPHFLMSNRASNDGNYNQLNVFMHMELYREVVLEKVNLIGVKLTLSFSEKDIQHSLRPNYADDDENKSANVHQTTGMLQTHRFTIPKSYTTVLTEQKVFEVIRLWVKNENDTMDDGKLTQLPNLLYNEVINEEQIEKLIWVLRTDKHDFYVVLRTIAELMKQKSKELKFGIANYDAFERIWYVKTLLLGRENAIEIITQVKFSESKKTDSSASVNVLLLGRKQHFVVARRMVGFEIPNSKAMRDALCEINTATYEDIETQFATQFLNFQHQTLSAFILRHLELH